MSNKKSTGVRCATSVPNKLSTQSGAITSLRGNSEMVKYEVRSTKYEVKELGATALRGQIKRRQSRNDAWELNSCTRNVEAPSARRASVTRMGISMAAFLGNFIGTDVPVRIRPPLHRQEQRCRQKEPVSRRNRLRHSSPRGFEPRFYD